MIVKLNQLIRLMWEVVQNTSLVLVILAGIALGVVLTSCSSTPKFGWTHPQFKTDIYHWRTDVWYCQQRGFDAVRGHSIRPQTGNNRHLNQAVIYITAERRKIDRMHKTILIECLLEQGWTPERL